MTFKEAVEKLKKADIDSARSEAAAIFCAILKVDSARLPLIFDEDFDSAELSEAIEKRCARIPLQYVLGECEFFGIELCVSPDCLCPRPDTEILVETALSLLPSDAEFLELCTGSGCIPIALCKTREDVRGIATDKFENTLAAAEKNVSRHALGDRIDLRLADLFDEPDFIGERRFDAIISNPPYIPKKVIDTLSAEVRHEPIAALDGGADGFDFYRRIVSGYAKFLKASGVIIFEIGYDQANGMKILAKDHGFDCRIVKDLGGNDRVAVLYPDKCRPAENQKIS